MQTVGSCSRRFAIKSIAKGEISIPHHRRRRVRAAATVVPQPTERIQNQVALVTESGNKPLKESARLLRRVTETFLRSVRQGRNIKDEVCHRLAARCTEVTLKPWYRTTRWPKNQAKLVETIELLPSRQTAPIVRFRYVRRESLHARPVASLASRVDAPPRLTAITARSARGCQLVCVVPSVLIVEAVKTINVGGVMRSINRIRRCRRRRRVEQNDIMNRSELVCSPCSR